MVCLRMMITGFNKSWLPPVQDELNKRCKKYRWLANVQDIVVINDDLARKYKLIL